MKAIVGYDLFGLRCLSRRDVWAGIAPRTGCNMRNYSKLRTLAATREPWSFLASLAIGAVSGWAADNQAPQGYYDFQPSTAKQSSSRRG